MKTSSCKAKGRMFQQLIRDLLLDYYPLLLPDDIKVAIMGLHGEDIKMSPLARKHIPYSFLCKRQESINIYKSILQCLSNSKLHTPIVVFRKNRGKTYCCILFLHLLKILTNKLEK